MKLQEVLTEILKSRNLQVAKLAREIDVSAKTIHEWTSGRSPRDLDAVKRCADYLGVSLNYLLFAEKETQINLESLIEKTTIHTGIYELSIRRIETKK